MLWNNLELPDKKVFYKDEAVLIYCADCRDILPQIPDKSTDLVLTSPPYPGNNKMWGALFKDDNIDEAHSYLNSIWDGCLRILKGGCKLAINIANTKRRPYIPNNYYIYKHLLGKIEPIGEIIWDKGYGQLGTAWGSFRCPSDPALADQHEYILVFRQFGNREKPDIYDKIDCFDFKSWRNSIWEISPAKAGMEKHIAPFPEEIPRRLITLYSFADEIILDPFLGSGTTAYCAKKLNRKCIGIEISEKYCEIAAKRCYQAVMNLEIYDNMKSPMEVMKMNL